MVQKPVSAEDVKQHVEEIVNLLQGGHALTTFINTQLRESARVRGDELAIITVSSVYRTYPEHRGVYISHDQMLGVLKVVYPDWNITLEGDAYTFIREKSVVPVTPDEARVVFHRRVEKAAAPYVGRINMALRLVNFRKNENFEVSSEVIHVDDDLPVNIDLEDIYRYLVKHFGQSWDVKRYGWSLTFSLKK